MFFYICRTKNSDDSWEKSYMTKENLNKLVYRTTEICEWYFINIHYVISPFKVLNQEIRSVYTGLENIPFKNILLYF